ncbi:hypothetical protein B296_00038766, partial [Ensete ventricosum]
MARAAANRRDHPRAWLAPAGEAPPSGMVLVRKGGTCKHSARRSCHLRGYGARPPTRAMTPAIKGAA